MGAARERRGRGAGAAWWARPGKRGHPGVGRPRSSSEQDSGWPPLSWRVFSGQDEELFRFDPQGQAEGPPPQSPCPGGRSRARQLRCSPRVRGPRAQSQVPTWSHHGPLLGHALEGWRLTPWSVQAPPSPDLRWWTMLTVSVRLGPRTATLGVWTGGRRVPGGGQKAAEPLWALFLPFILSRTCCVLGSPGPGQVCWAGRGARKGPAGRWAVGSRGWGHTEA